MPSGEQDVDTSIPSAEFQNMGKDTRALPRRSVLRGRSFSRSSSDGTEAHYIEASRAQMGAAVGTPNAALSPSSASSANDRYQLMEENEHEAGLQQFSTEPEKLQQSLQRVQRRVSDSWRSLQDASKRLATGRANSGTFSRRSSVEFLSPSDESRHTSDEARDEVEEVSNDHRFIRKAVRSLKKSWSRQSGLSAYEDEANTGQQQSMDGYIRHRDVKSNVVFTPTTDVVIT